MFFRACNHADGDGQSLDCSHVNLEFIFRAMLGHPHGESFLPN
jgi:hypothetical protein